MKILIRQAIVVDPNSKHHLSKKDLFIDKGEIVKISKNIKPKGKFQTVEEKNLKVSPGWVEMNANFCDPGFEHNEDLQTGTQAAASGGYTDVCILPNTNPIISSKSQVEYINHFSKNNIINLHPLGALTEDTKNENPTEIYDMAKAGAIAFTNGMRSIKNGFVLNRALHYVLPFKGLICAIPDEGSFSNCVLINEGKISLSNGFKGIPHIAEEMAIDQFLKLLAYSKSRLHLMQLSCSSSVAQIKAAKKSGLHISAAVSPYALFLQDKVLENFDSNYKISPPLRTKKDSNALLKGLVEGTIDVISCLHQPLNEDQKKVEFEFAKPGMIGLQTCYSLIKTYAHQKISDALFVEKLAINPRKILNLPEATLHEGQQASITLFNDTTWLYTKKNNQSKSYNSPFIQQKLKGKIVGIINKGKLFLNQI